MTLATFGTLAGKGAVVTGALEAPGSELLGKDAGVLAGLPANGVLLSADLWTMSANADGILDFTVPGATIANVAIAAQRGLVHVIGTTGLSSSDDAVIKSVTSRATVVKSGNMSLGINLLAALVKRVAQSLDEDFDIEILEMHHKAKVDAPSGTAIVLQQAMRDASSKHGELEITSFREGDVVGMHEVVLESSADRIYLCHDAKSRHGFAEGAVRAAEWLAGKKGFYDFKDVWREL